MKRAIDGSEAVAAISVAAAAATTTHTAMVEADEDELSVRINWSGKIFPVELSPSSTIADLKVAIYELTEVLPRRQKVLGLPRVVGMPQPTDETLLSTVPFKPDHKIMVIGTREADISLLQAYESTAAEAAKSDGVVNDLDLDYDYGAVEGGDISGDSSLTVRYAERNKRKLKRRLDSTEIQIINPPRPGKKLLVLDLDYTLFDCKGMGTEMISDLARPGMHQFLTTTYEYYDIVIWSQTSWRWLEAKLTELSMLTHNNYKLCFVLDRSSMFAITSRRGRWVLHLMFCSSGYLIRVIWCPSSDMSYI
jgi:ubiquitin-like domain-containing CTD phosphatase 1